MVNDLICNLLMSYAVTKKLAIRKRTASGSEDNLNYGIRI